MHTGSRGQGSRGRKDHGVGSPDHFSRHAKQNGNEMKQVMNHNKDNGLLNITRGQAPCDESQGVYSPFCLCL